MSGPGVHCRVVAARRLKKASVRRALRAPRLKKARERSRSAGAEEAQTPEEGERALEERRR